MSKKIFLVEDENIIREMYEHALIKRGYTVESAEDGEQALAKLKDITDLDLILLDVMIPKVDGLSVLKELKKETSNLKNIPVILLTNLGQEDLLKEALETGAEKYYIKSNILPMKMVDEIDVFLKGSDSS